MLCMQLVIIRLMMLLHFSLKTFTPVQNICNATPGKQSSRIITTHLVFSLLQHHYMRAGTWALKHQRHSVVLNFAQNCPLPISQLQSCREFNFNFNPIISFNPKLIPANRFFPNRWLARNNERSKDANVFVFGENGQLFKLLTFSLLVKGLVLVYFPQTTENSEKNVSA